MITCPKCGAQVETEILREQVADALTAPLPEWRGGPDREYWLARADAALDVICATLDGHR